MLPKYKSYRCSLPFDEVDGLDHVKAELDAAVGVVTPGHGEAGHAVVAVAKQLDPEATRFLKGGDDAFKN